MQSPLEFGIFILNSTAARIVYVSLEGGSLMQNVRKASSILGNSKSKIESAFNPEKKVLSLS